MSLSEADDETPSPIMRWCVLSAIQPQNVPPKRALPQNSIHAHWKPPYPPTGSVEKYVVRLGVNNTDGKFGDSEVIWRRRIEVGDCRK